MKQKRILCNIHPQDVFYYFEEITKIPRGSGNEKSISDYIVNIAKEQGYEVAQDASYNVAVEVPATEGYENRKKTIIQAHIDMVCEKNEGSDHDFTKDPIDIYIDGEYIKARNTTLGADDGSGVAMMLAIMTAKDIKHPPLQLLFTTGEEIFFVGAMAMEKGFIDGEQLIGLDCSSSDVIMVSCAGLSESEFSLPIKRESSDGDEDNCFFRIRVKNLVSGHSGNMIHMGRVNGIKLIGEILQALDEIIPFDLISIHSEGKVNVINRAAEAVIRVNNSDFELISETIESILNSAKQAYLRTEPEMKLQAEKQTVGCDVRKITEEDKKALIKLITLLPYGANTMIDDQFTLAESSLNIGSLLVDDETVSLLISIRSNSEYQHDVLLRKCRAISEVIGATFEIKSKSMPWEFNPTSSLLRNSERLFKKLNGHEPILKKIHASVEAIVFIEKMKQKGKNIDIINVGCDQYDVHTTKERLKISSVEKVYRLLKALLEESE